MESRGHLLAGRYEVGPLVGAGGMAEVYEGYDRLLSRRVAIKVLLSHYARDPAFLARFKREAQAAASLSHPNIVGVYDTGAAEDGTHFIIMEYVQGRSLREVLHTEGPLPPERAVEILHDVCAGLAAAHARGLIHRDIKPGNIMLTPDGTVKVMDFGIARAVSGETITQTHAVVGTAQYISPEQAQGMPVDPRSDLYSLGCCLYELLTGQVPFGGSSPVAIAYRHVREQPVPPRRLNPDVPRPLEAVCLKLLAKRPEERYQTAVELQRDLARLLSGQPPLLAGTLAASTPAPGSYGTGAGGYDDRPTQVLLGPGSPAGPPGRRPPGPRRQAEERPRPLGWALLTGLFVLLVIGVAFLVAASLNPGGANRQVTSPSLTTLPPTTPTLAAITTTSEQTTTSRQVTTTRATTTVPPTTRATTTVTTRATTTTEAEPELEEVPDVVGEELDEARAELRARGFDVDVRRVPADEERENTVLFQNPQGGTEAPRGSTVTLFVGR